MEKWGIIKVFKLIAGTCVVENEEITMRTATRLKEITDNLDIELIYKGSFDKANRTSHKAERGMGGMYPALKVLDKVKCDLGLKILTDVHETYQVPEVAEVVDIIQIPALLSRQTDLIYAAARTGKIVNIKKGQFMSAYDSTYAISKAGLITGDDRSKVWITERGTTFGYNNLIVDMRSLESLKKTGCDVIFDASHSVQTPSTGVFESGGKPEFIAPLARAAIAVGVDGIFIETHPKPWEALSDGASSLPLDEMEDLLITLKRIHEAAH